MQCCIILCLNICMYLQIMLYLLYCVYCIVPIVYVHWILQNALAHFIVKEIIDFTVIPDQKSFGFLVKGDESSAYIYYCYQSTINEFNSEVMKFTLASNSCIFMRVIRACNN